QGQPAYPATTGLDPGPSREPDLAERISSCSAAVSLMAMDALVPIPQSKRSGWGQDRPTFAPVRSRSQGPLADQVADAPNPRGQCRSWVELPHSGQDREGPESGTDPAVTLATDKRGDCPEHDVISQGHGDAGLLTFLPAS